MFYRNSLRNVKVTLFLLLFVSVKAFSQNTTFKDVANIFETKCAVCHKPGEAAPFSLLTYEDIKNRASFIKHVIETRYMPPWRADAHYRDYSNNRSLSKPEILKIVSWINNNAPRGDYPKNKSIISGISSSENRQPDLTLKIDKPFLVKGDNLEKFIVFKIPFEIDSERNVEAVEFVCNNKKIIHHVNYGFYNVPDTGINIYADSSYVDTDIKDDKIHQYDKYYQIPMNYYTGWIPGASIESYPPGIGWKMPKRGVVLLTAHYSSIAVDEKSIVGINLYFTKKPIKREVQIVSLGSAGIGEDDISPPLFLEPNKIQTFKLKVRTQEDQSIMYVWPHMHYLGKEFTAFAVTPQNDTIPLVHIPAWDFRWQELYKMKKFVYLPAGSEVNMIGTYDNTANNPFNPHSPPQFVVSTDNMEATDEMFTLIMIYVSYRKGDENLNIE